MWGSSTTLQHAAPDLKVCEACGTKLDAALVRPTYECGKCRLDASSTYDNYLIVSAAFRDVVIGRDLTGARFTVLPAAPGFYVLDAPNIVAFDVERRRTHFAKHCDTCNRYLEVAGATPAYLRELPRADFSSTDILFGSGNELQPLKIISDRARQALEAARLKGLCVVPVQA